MLIKNEHPTFSIKLPLLKKNIDFRPYLVKDEKILLMAMESNDTKDYMTAIKQVIQNCVIGKEDIDNWPLVDIEYFFLQLRAKSVGEISTPVYSCQNVVDGKTCGNLMKMPIDISKIEPKNINQDPLIKLSSKLFVKMTYPKMKSISDDSKNLVEDLIISCIDQIIDGSQIYLAKDCKKEDLIEFVDNLSKPQIMKIEEFLQNLPILETEIEHTCEKCKYVHKILLRGYESFFV